MTVAMIRSMGLALAAALAAPAVAAAAIVVEQPELRASIGTLSTSAAYMTVRNTGPKPDRLLAAKCDCAAMAMLHRSTEAGGVARMSMEGSVTIPPGGAVAFAPNGRHIMLTGVKAPIRPGAKVPIELRFEKAGIIKVLFTASNMPGMAAPAGQTHAHH